MAKISRKGRLREQRRGPDAVWINRYHLAAVTEATAALISTYMGRGQQMKLANAARQRALPARAEEARKVVAMHDTTARRLAIRYFIRCLKESYLRASIRYCYPHADVHKPWPWHNVMLGSGPDDWKLDLVAIPGDGIRDLLDGHDSGAISAVAAGPQGSFRLPEHHLEDDEGPGRFFLLTLSKEMSLADPALTTPLRSGERLLSEYLTEQRLVERLRQVARERNGKRELTIGLMERDQPKCLLEHLRGHRVRIFHGSSVAAAVSAFLPNHGIDAFMSVLSGPQAMMIAVAAKAVDGGMFVVPTRPQVLSGREKPISPHYVSPKSQVLVAEDFVTNRDTFLLATAVTDTLSLKGVRFEQGGRVCTSTICFYARDMSVRMSTNSQMLDS